MIHSLKALAVAVTLVASSPVLACSFAPIHIGINEIRAVSDAAGRMENPSSQLLGITQVRERTYHVELQSEQGARYTSVYSVRWVENNVPGQPACPRIEAAKIAY